jgi:hypothetical protein
MSGDLFARLVVVDIRSRNQLLKWFRDRFPNQYRTRSLLGGGRNDKEMLEEIWADYLCWAER